MPSSLVKERQRPTAEALTSPSPSLSPPPSIPRSRTPDSNYYRLTFANPSLDLAIAFPSPVRGFRALISCSLVGGREQMPAEDLVELRFRLYDGSDIDKKIIPKLANDVKLISGGKILDNSKTITQCRPSFGELPGGVITMHVVVQPSSIKSKTAVPAAKPRVVPIPVHFVGSDETPGEAARSAAAATILRVLRGHLMRRNVRVVSVIEPVDPGGRGAVVGGPEGVAVDGWDVYGAAPPPGFRAQGGGVPEEGDLAAGVPGFVPGPTPNPRIIRDP
ncbi:hypothetical protein BHE74_00029440 [Ensete ventricosum]|nr:hypothetical protein BHE74_00029440 [Ensete ventricosum]